MTPPAPRWPVVVFDLDGTLVDSVGLIVASYQHAFRTVLGVAEEEERIRGWIGQPLARAFREVSAERADELLAAYLAWNLAHTEALIRRYDGVDRLLGTLVASGVRLAAATSKMREPAELAARLAGLTDHLGVLVTMEDTDRHKPDPQPLLLAVERLGARPQDAVYVGDAVVDVEAARRAGMAAVAVTWGAGTRVALEAAGPDVLTDSVDALLAALLRVRRVGDEPHGGREPAAPA